jgi:hypothetical protein
MLILTPSDGMSVGGAGWQTGFEKKDPKNSFVDRYLMIVLSPTRVQEIIAVAYLAPTLEQHLGTACLHHRHTSAKAKILPSRCCRR